MLPRTTIYQLTAAAPPVALEDSALAVMTDLKIVRTVTIDPEASLKHAMRLMVRRNVRLLLAVNVDDEVEGLITATDLLGEKPLIFLREHGGRWNDIQVRDIMTPHDRLEVLAFEDVARARVGQVVATLQRMRRQHALVADFDSNGNPMIRGVLSASQLARQLGRSLQIGDIAHSFADIEAALNHR